MPLRSEHVPVLVARGASAMCLCCLVRPAVCQSEDVPPYGTVQHAQQVVVTGTRLSQAAEQTAQDVRTYDRARLERSGQTTVADFLATVPEASLNSLESTFLATSVRLRGTREGSTLILINGRRTQAVTGSAAPFGFFDLNTIPMAMVDHIDVLPSGSSAIYGGEALAGVVNIVLRADFDGAEASLSYEGAKSTDKKTFILGAGTRGESLHLSFMGTYTERSALLGRDRAITASPDYRRFGGPNLGTPPFGAPANVSSPDGSSKLPGLGSSFAAVPVGSSGIGLQPSDFIATAGTRNTGSFTSYQSLVPDSREGGVFISADYRLASDAHLFAEVLASHYEIDVASTPPFLLQADVPASNAFNPFGAPVRVSGVVQGAENLAAIHLRDDFVRPLVGARGKLGGWEWEASALASRDRGSNVTTGQPDTPALTAALASSDPGAALNPFVDGPMASPDLLASIYSGATRVDFKAEATLLNAFVRGPAMQLPGGPLATVVGAEYEKDSMARGFEADRTAKAAFAELRAPLLAGSNPAGGRRELLTVVGAARSDHYSDFGSKATWEAGIEFRPRESLLLRGTHGTAFKPPTLYNLAAPPRTGPTPITDPQRGGESVVVQAITGGNPDLRPTTGDSSTLGLVWSPKAFGGLDLSLTAWTLRIANAISLPSPQYIVGNESLYPGRVVRAPSVGGQPGQLLSIDYSYVNFGSMREQGVDLGADWRLVTSAGTFTPAIAGTWMTKFNGASTPGGPDVQRLSRANADGMFAPRLKATASLGWRPGDAFNASVSGRYVGRYVDYTPPRTLGNFWYLDAAVDFAVGRLWGTERGITRRLTVQVGGTNLANKLPPYATHFRGYDVYNYDLVGRTLFVRLRWQP